MTEKDTKKKTSFKKKKINPEKFIELNPTLSEDKKQAAVLTFGRFNPPTQGHEKLAQKVMTEAKSRNGIPMIFASHSQDKKKNPLSYESKIKYLQKAFGRIVQKSKARTIIEVAKELSGKFSSLIVVVGSDRVSEFQRLLSKYNDKEYNFDTIEVISAGERDPDADDVTGMSASKLRTLAVEGDFELFRKGLPKKLQASAEDIYDELRTNMGLSEEALDERAPLTIQQRRARGRTMRRLKTRMQAARKRSARKKASTEKLKARARKKARNIIRDRLAGGKKYSDMSPSEKVQLDKRLHRIPDAAISRIATRQLPQVRRAEMDRLARMRGGGTKNESLDLSFTNFLFERRICPPKKPHMAMTKEGKVKFDRRFKFFRKEAQTELDESFIEEAVELMGLVESFIGEQSAMERTREQIRREKETTKARHERMKDAARRTDQAQRNESADPANREQGTDSLVKIYKKDTPGQKQESYFDSEIPNSFGDFRKGSRVSFSSHSMDMADDDTEKEGTVVGSTLQHLRVRDDDGILYRVRHTDAELIGE
jgi:nicotinic acid mononucleotide adenylyltransferase